MNPLILLFLIASAYCVTFETAMENLLLLEKNTKEYMAKNSQSETLEALILSYVRSVKYTGSEWSIAAGETPDGLISYITNIDKTESTTMNDLRNYGEVTLPTGEKIDFVHLFAAMNGIENNDFQASLAGLTGWAGDTAQLFQDIKAVTGNLETLVTAAAGKLGVSGQFGEGDLISDLDAVNIMKLRYENPKTEFATLMTQYYENGYQDRIKNFVAKTFPTLSATSAKSDYRYKVFSEYSGNSFIQILECKYGLRSSLLSCYIPGSIKSAYTNHQKAAAYAFADYLYDKSH